MAITSAPLALSRLPVGSSARSRSGSVTRARAMATRCCCPPDSSVGSWSRRSASPNRSRAAVARAARSRAADALVGEGHGHVLERRRARQQVVGLEDEADGPAAQARQAVVVELVHVRAAQPIAALRRPVEAADDVHERRLAGARRPDDGHELPAPDVEVDAVEGTDVEPARVVDAVDVGQRDERLVGGLADGIGGGHGQRPVTRAGGITARPPAWSRVRPPRPARRPGSRPADRAWCPCR